MQYKEDSIFEAAARVLESKDETLNAIRYIESEFIRTRGKKPFGESLLYIINNVKAAVTKFGYNETRSGGEFGMELANKVQVYVKLNNTDKYISVQLLSDRNSAKSIGDSLSKTKSFSNPLSKTSQKDAVAHINSLL
jgi:hypothetical protein